jgi:hypothetical protein
VVVRTPVGFHKEPEMYDLTLKGIARSGGPADLGFIDVMNVDDSRAFMEFPIMRPSDAGQLTLRVPPGTYSVMGFLLGPGELVLLGDPEVEITADVTVVLDVRQSNEYVIETKDDTQPWDVTLSYFRQPLQGSPIIHGFITLSPERFFAAPTEAVTKGSFEHFHWWHLIRPGATPATSPFLYDLMLVDPDRIPDSVHYTVGDGDVATLENRYHSHVATQRSVELRAGFRPFQTFILTLGRELRGPLHRTEYVSAGDTLWRQQMWIQFPFFGLMFEPRTHYEGGEHRDQSWFRQPARPGVLEGTDLEPGLPARRVGNSLVLSLPEWVDAHPGHWGFMNSSVDTTAFRLFRDGQLVAQSNRAAGSFPMSSEPAEYRLELHVARTADWWRYSTETHTAWTLQSTEPPPGVQQILPLLLVDYDLNLDLLNQAPLPQERSAPNMLDFTVRPQRGAAGRPVQGLRLWVSYDDGATWKQKQVRSRAGGRFRAILDQRDFEETSGFVSLRVEAWDEGGNRIEQEITRAYALKPRD